MRFWCVLLAVVLVAGLLPADPSAQWASDPTRNTALRARNLPSAIGPENLMWEVQINATWMYSQPTIGGGRIVVGATGNGVEDPAIRAGRAGGSVFCLDQQTGKRLWEMPTRNGFYGVCTAPVIQGNRVWIVGADGDVLCLDLDGQSNGNDGPFKDELAYFSDPKQPPLTELKPTWGDILWRYDLKKELGVEYHDAISGTPLLVGNQLWVTTSQSYHTNDFEFEDGVLKKIDMWGPNIAVLDATTGQLLAHDDLVIPATFHGQWASLALSVVNGRKQVIFGDGFGWCRGFDAEQFAPPTSATNGVPTLRELWRVDCNPPDYRYRDGVPRIYPNWRDGHGMTKGPEGRQRTMGGPCEIIATPLVWNDRIYVALGRDYVYCPKEGERALGDGFLCCIDAYAEGDLTGRVEKPRKKPTTGTATEPATRPATDRAVPPSGIMWSTKDIGRVLASMAIEDGLLYAVDLTGRLHCFDAITGERIWEHDLGAKVWCSSPLVADGKIYVGTSKRVFFILKAGREKQVLFEGRTNGEIATPTAVDGMLIVFTPKRLSAYRK